MGAAFDTVVAPLSLFIVFYAGALYVIAPRMRASFYWASLISAVIATAAVVAIWDRGKWRLGLVTSPRIALRDSAAGLLIAAVLIGAANLLIIATTGFRHSAGNGFPLAEFFRVFLPASVHEELLFRGYPFQRLWRWSRVTAVAGVSALFALMHAANLAVTPLALTNIFLGGILLSLAYAATERLWLPIALHLGWNLMSGPVLGYEVSGYPPEQSIVRTGGTGPDLLTGGAFGIEGSVWMTLVEIAAIALLFRHVRRREC